MNVRPNLTRQFTARPPNSIPDGFFEDHNGHLKPISEKTQQKPEKETTHVLPKLRRVISESVPSISKTLGPFSPRKTENIFSQEELDANLKVQSTLRGALGTATFMNELEEQEKKWEISEEEEEPKYSHEDHEKRVQVLMKELAKYNIYDSAPASAAAVKRGNNTAEKYAELYEEELQKMIEKAKQNKDILGRPPHPNQMGGDIFC